MLDRQCQQFYPAGGMQLALGIARATDSMRQFAGHAGQEAMVFRARCGVKFGLNVQAAQANRAAVDGDG